MFLARLKLLNFRNFAKLDLDFAQTTLLLGDNAQGKSNLLEAIYFLATTKSTKADPDIQLIKQNENICRVEGGVDNEEITKLEIAMEKRPEEVGGGLSKRVKVNGVPRRTLDYLGNLVVVHFSPEDINLVTGPPALRRWHIDLVLAQVDKEYKRAITDYVSVITSRNRLLKRIKEGQAQVDELSFWTDKLLEYGKIVADKRAAFFVFLNSRTTELPGRFAFLYKSNELTSERLKHYLGREIAASASLIGPHRDDFEFEMDGRNLAHFGSRGEQRMAVLELKTAELKFVTEIVESTPVLLLDDVFSELDEEHREQVFSLISRQQTVLSAIESEKIPSELMQAAKIVRIEKGAVSVSGENGKQPGKAGK